MTATRSNKIWLLLGQAEIKQPQLVTSNNIKYTGGPAADSTYPDTYFVHLHHMLVIEPNLVK